MNFIDAQMPHALQKGLAVILGQVGFDDGFDGVPTQQGQLGHVTESHHPAQPINKAAQRLGVVRVGGTKGGRSQTRAGTLCIGSAAPPLPERRDENQ